ncbi:uncharacterized protein CDAR_279841 [Caerostris darwini]|uniref:Uncharacterized protein n=1 Tax=Caerostris darwini TaxID=1538125 RepID=A0AAV4V360_9ARAC|nr:uncharacterized protein CDAR_279841 [Caerostris darwini]
MLPTNSCSLWMKVASTMVVVCLLWRMAEGCENATEGTAPLGVFTHHTALNSCITDIIRAVCNALRPSPMKRNSELINSILGLPRVLQEAGR